jgi:hypothetical protein
MARVLRRATVVSVLALVMAIPVSGQEASPAPWDPITPGSSPAPMSRPVLAGSWSVIPDAPWGTIFPAAAYTGEELLVVDLPTGRTLTYDPATRVWTRHERSPEPFDGVSPSVWTGTELVILDRYRANRDYAYDPEARTWRKLARSPLDEQWLAVLAGEDIVVRGRKRDMAMYDLAADRWSILPEPPGGRVNSLHWTGSEVLAVMSGGGPSAVRVAALDPGSRTWSDAVAVPLHARSPGAVWIDARPVFPDGAAPPGTAADAQAIDDFDCLASAGPALWTGDLLVGRYADAALDPETGECYDLPDIEVWDAFTDDESRAWVTTLWTGEELFWWSGAFGDSRLLYTDGIAFRPTSSEGSAAGAGQASGAVAPAASPVPEADPALIAAAASLPSVLWPDAPVPASLAEYLPAAREQLWAQATDGLRLPLHLRFLEARCSSDGGVALVFEEIGRPFFLTTYAYAVRGSMPTSPDDSWGGGYGMASVLDDSEFIHDMGPDHVACP